MNAVLDFTGAIIFFVLNIVLFPIFLLVHGIIFLWMFEKYLSLQIRKMTLRFRNRSYQPADERRGLAFLRKAIRMSH